MKKKKLKKQVAKLRRENSYLKSVVAEMNIPRVRVACSGCGCLISRATVSASGRTGICKRCKKRVWVVKKVM